MDPNTIPPALAALAAFPDLHEQVGRSVAAQARRIAERQAHYIARPALLKSLDERIRATGGGLIALEGAPGSGATALLCHLAATRPYAFWLPEDDAGEGVAALYAQLLALHQLPIALVPPAVDRDATALEQLLAEAGAARPAGDPLVVLIGRPPDDQATPIAPLFPATIPPGVVIVLACAPKASLPLRAAARVALPASGTRLQQRLTQAAIQRGCAPELAPADRGIQPGRVPVRLSRHRAAAIRWAASTCAARWAGGATPSLVAAAEPARALARGCDRRCRRADRSRTLGSSGRKSARRCAALAPALAAIPRSHRQPRSNLSLGNSHVHRRAIRQPARRRTCRVCAAGARAIRHAARTAPARARWLPGAPARSAYRAERSRDPG